MKAKGRTVIIERSGKPVTRVEPPGKTVCLKDLPLFQNQRGLKQPVCSRTHGGPVWGREGGKIEL
jgi:hypothetical protein